MRTARVRCGAIGTNNAWVLTAASSTKRTEPRDMVLGVIAFVGKKRCHLRVTGARARALITKVLRSVSRRYACMLDTNQTFSLHLDLFL